MHDFHLHTLIQLVSRASDRILVRKASKELFDWHIQRTTLLL